MMTSFIGALLGALAAYAVIYGAFLVVAYRKRKRVNARVAKLLSDFLASTAKAEKADSVVNPNAN